MKQFQRQHAPSVRSSNTPAASSDAVSELNAQQIRRLIQNPAQSPHLMRLAQQQLGNQAVQRLMHQAESPSPSRPQSKPQSIQRAAVIQQRTGYGVMQRNPFKWIKNKVKKWIHGQASEATFGGNAERQADPSEAYYNVEEKNPESFSRVNSIDVASGPNGEHKLKGRQYLAKDASKGAYAGKTILFLAGSSGTAEDYSKDSALYYCKEGANLLAVNYRGFGRSTTSDDKGQNRKMDHTELTDTMLYEDTRAMFNWLTNNGVAADKVIVHGYSLGGAMAANLVAALAGEGIRVAGLVFHSAIDSARKVAVRSMGKKLGNLGSDNLGSEFDTLAAMQSIATNNPELLDLPIAAFSGGKDSGDHLDDNETNLSGQMTGMGFSNVGAKSRGERSHAPDHLESLAIKDLVKQKFGVDPKQVKAKQETQVEDGVKEI